MYPYNGFTRILSSAIQVPRIFTNALPYLELERLATLF